MRVAVACSGVALALIWGCSAAPGGSGANGDKAGGGINIAGEEGGEEKKGEDQIETSVEGEKVDDKGGAKPPVEGGEQQGDDAVVDQGDALDQGGDVEGGEGDQDQIAQQSTQDGADQGGVDQGGVDQGGVDQGGADQGGVDQGGGNDVEQQHRQEIQQQVQQQLAQEGGKEIFLQDMTDRFGAIRMSLERFADDAAREPFMERVNAIQETLSKFAEIQQDQVEREAVELYLKVEKLEKELAQHGDLG